MSSQPFLITLQRGSWISSNSTELSIAGSPAGFANLMVMECFLVPMVFCCSCGVAHLLRGCGSFGFCLFEMHNVCLFAS